MFKRILLAGVLGGLTLFFWGFVAHGLLPLGEVGLAAAPPPPGDAPLMQLLSTTLPEDAVYVAPGFDWEKRKDDAAQEEYMQRSAAGPRALIIVDHGVSKGMGPMLAKEALTDVVVALVAAVLLSCTLGGCCSSYVSRVLFVSGLGLAACFHPIQQSTWWGAPCDFTAAAVAMLLIGFTLMGVVIAAIVKPQVTPAP